MDARSKLISKIISLSDGSFSKDNLRDYTLLELIGLKDSLKESRKSSAVSSVSTQ